MDSDERRRAQATLDRAARNRRRDRLVFGFAALLLLGTLVWAVLENRATGDYLVECTTPSTSDSFHECYELGQRRTAEAIKVLLDGQRYNAAMVLCVLDVPPEKRTPETRTKCEAKARAEVENP